MCAHAYVCAHVRACACMCVHVRAYVCVCVRVRVRVCVYMCGASGEEGRMAVGGVGGGEVL